jgi:hypothetical protein
MSQGQEEGGGAGVVGMASGMDISNIEPEERRAGSRAEEAKDDGVLETQKQRPASAAPAASSMLANDGARPGEQVHDHQQQEEAARGTGQASPSGAVVDGGSTVVGGVDYPEVTNEALGAAAGHEDGASASSSSASSSSSSGNDERDDGNGDGDNDNVDAATKGPADGAEQQDGGDFSPSAVASDAAAADDGGGGGGGGGGDGEAVGGRGDVGKEDAEEDGADVQVAGVGKEGGEAIGSAKSGKLPSGQAGVELPTAEEAKIKAHEERREPTLEERQHDAEKHHIERTHHRLEHQQGGWLKPKPPGAAGGEEKQRRKLGASMSLSIPNLGFAIPYGPNRESARSK